MEFEFLGKKVNMEVLLYTGPGMEYYENGMYEDAIEMFSKALRIDPNNQNLYIMRGAANADAILSTLL